MAALGRVRSCVAIHARRPWSGSFVSFGGGLGSFGHFWRRSGSFVSAAASSAASARRCESWEAPGAVASWDQDSRKRNIFLVSAYRRLAHSDR